MFQLPTTQTETPTRTLAAGCRKQSFVRPWRTTSATRPLNNRLYSPCSRSLTTNLLGIVADESDPEVHTFFSDQMELVNADQVVVFDFINQKRQRWKWTLLHWCFLGHGENIPSKWDPCLCQGIPFCGPCNSLLWNSCYSVKTWTNGSLTIRAAHTPIRNINVRSDPTWH